MKTQNTQISSQTETETQTPSPRPTESARPRVGKIARLPDKVREELNLRLEAGEGGESLLEWLNGLPETVALLQRDFGGQPINKQNLSDWRKGGFAEWVLRRELVEQAESARDLARQMRGSSQGFLIDDVLSVFTAHYAGFLTRWDGELSPEFEARMRLFSRLRRDLLSLQKSAHWGVRQAEEWERIQLEREKRLKEELKEKAMAPLRANQRRNELNLKYGLAGVKLADRLNIIDYGETDPSFFTNEELMAEDWYHEEEEELSEMEAEADSEAAEPEASQTSAVKPSPVSQAKADSVQKVEAEPAPAKTAPSESSQVKPFSEASGQGGRTAGA